MRKLTNAQARAVLALVHERDEAIAAINEYVRYLGQGMRAPAVRHEADGLYLVDMAELADEKEGEGE